MKKKGLIISTVVMVVVLIASLTTATYAWFSSQAQATVDDLAITTQAATGLQIAMTGTKNSLTNLYSGDLTFENDMWSGTDGWGTYLGFSSIEVGQLEHAVTYFKENDTLKEFDGYVKTSDTKVNANNTYYTVAEATTTAGTTSVVGMFVKSGDKYIYTADKTAKEDTKYYNITIVENPVDADIANYYNLTTKDTTITAQTKGYYQPLGYNDKMQPTGYRKVSANQKGTYYHLTMAVTNIMEVGALGFSIEVIPSGDTQLSQKVASVNNPGMAAASRIEVGVKKDGGAAEKVTTLAPFSDWKLQANKTMNSTKESNGYDAAKDGVSNSSGKYTYVLDSGTVQANSIYYVNMTIWVEGTDAECDNSTTGTGMTFYINYAYAPSQSTDIAWNWQNSAGTASIITFA